MAIHLALQNINIAQENSGKLRVSNEDSPILLNTSTVTPFDWKIQRGFSVISIALPRTAPSLVSVTNTWSESSVCLHISLEDIDQAVLTELWWNIRLWEMLSWLWIYHYLSTRQQLERHLSFFFDFNSPLQFEATYVLVKVVNSIIVPDSYHEVHDWQWAKTDFHANNNII